VLSKLTWTQHEYGKQQQQQQQQQQHEIGDKEKEI